MPLGPNFFLNQESFRNWAIGANETDCAYWDAWVQQNPEHAPTAHLAAALVVGFKNTGSLVSDDEIAKEWHRLQARLHSDVAPPVAKHVFIANWRALAAAASVIIALGVLGAWYLLTPVSTAYATALGQKKTIRLADGTVINLNVNSTLRTRSQSRFAPAREIWLEGEAYFKVVSHPEDESMRKFVVHTPGLDVNVVGTQFNVKARDKKTHVFLNEGKVRVTLTETVAADTLDLLPGDFVSYEPTLAPSRKISKKREKKYIQTWRNGFFTFNKMPLADVFELVESTHDLHLSVDDPKYLQEPLSGKIPTGNLPALFNSIASLYQLEYERVGDEVRFSAKKPEHGPPKP
jgi:ferric-dicitrate binding protein FerR (iron transport regulator)